MTASHPIDVEKLLADQLASASPDLLRNLLSTFIAALMSAEADALCGAGYGQRRDPDLLSSATPSRPELPGSYRGFDIVNPVVAQ
jgi:transposase-like protein